MIYRYLMAALCCLLILPAHAEDMTVDVWDPGCNHTMATNWFTLTPQQETQKIYIDLSGCSADQLGNLLFFGNYAMKTSGRQLSSKHKVRLNMTMLDADGNPVEILWSESGSVLADVQRVQSQGCWLTAENLNRNKDVTIRLRSQLIAPQ